MNENVYQFPKFAVRTDHERTISLAENPGEFCRHLSVVANVHQRTITCTHCKAVVDAFDYVNSIGKLITRAASELKFLRNETQNAGKELEALKKEAQNLKSRIKRAKPAIPQGGAPP